VIDRLSSWLAARLFPMPRNATTPPSPAARLMGSEREFALSSTGGKRLCADAILESATRCLPHLPGTDRGIYLATGARLYIDAGEHPEFCTPELADPKEVVCYENAADLTLQRLCVELGDRGGRPFLSRCNLDYRTLSTWACHENYGHLDVGENLREHLVPHLASRICFTGVGGLIPKHPGLQFCLSPRVCFLEAVVSSTSTERRAIYHSKNEPLAGGGWRRCHLLSGESNCSHRSTWLKMGTTALVLRLIELGCKPGAAVQLRHPLRAMRRFNVDPWFQTKAEMLDGRRLNALEIQRHYLARAKEHLSDLPAWADEVCQAWEDILRRLESGPHGVARTLDWAIKFSLYGEHARRRGLPWSALDGWNRTLSVWARCQRKLADNSPFPDLLAAAAKTRQGRCPPAIEARLRSRGLSGGGLKAFLELKAEVQELDLKYGAIGPAGLFNQLARAGLDHAVPGVTTEAIERAACLPPDSGRARLRGEWIAELARSDCAGDCRASWEYIVDTRNDRIIDLSSPFPDETAARNWVQDSRQKRSQIRQPQDHYGPAMSAYRQGNYERAHELLMLDHRSGAGHHWQLLAWVQVRRGFFTDALQALSQHSAQEDAAHDLDQLCDWLMVHRFAGLCPSRETPSWCDRLERLLPGEDLSDQDAFAAAEHRAYSLAHFGRLAESRTLLERLCRNSGRAENRIVARAHADLGEVCRRLGDRDAACRHLDHAEQMQLAGEFLGEMAELTLASKAKLAGSPMERVAMLKAARNIQTGLHDYKSLARTVLLEARLVPGDPAGSLAEFTGLREQVPALSSCTLASLITSHWPQWCNGESFDSSSDTFWGL
jgi:tetratricopeptide (TPR) repeat protein